MLKSIAARAIAGFERRWNYDGTYMRVLLAEGGFSAVRPLQALAGVARYRRDVPKAPYYAAKIAAAIGADCGSCAQLAVTMAERDGVGLATLRALAAGDRDALIPEARLGFDLARATLEHAPADDVRAAIVARWGARGLASLAYAIAAEQAFPAFKYALGYGRACASLRAGGADLPRLANALG